MIQLDNFEKLEKLKTKNKLNIGEYKKVYINNGLTNKERNIQRKITEIAQQYRNEKKRVTRL